MPVVTLYTKPGCGLCEEAEEVIETVRLRIPFELLRINILDDLADYERYKHDIPVILVNGREIARHHLIESQLVDALSGAGGAVA
jgi:glutaredoxin